MVSHFVLSIFGILSRLLNHLFTLLAIQFTGGSFPVQTYEFAASQFSMWMNILDIWHKFKYHKNILPWLNIEISYGNVNHNVKEEEEENENNKQKRKI